MLPVAVLNSRLRENDVSIPCIPGGERFNDQEKYGVWGIAPRVLIFSCLKGRLF